LAVAPSIRRGAVWHAAHLYLAKLAETAEFVSALAVHE